MAIPTPVHRTIQSQKFTPQAERTDDRRVVGDVTYVRFVECDHTMLGNPSMNYRPGDTCVCWACSGAEWSS